MSTLVAQTISNGTISTSSANVINGAKAWTTFSGLGSTSIKASYNISSITYNSTGRYTINFTNAMPNANYAVVGMTTGLATGDTKGQVAIVGDNNGASNKTTTACLIGTGDAGNGTPLNKGEIDIIFIGN